MMKKISIIFLGVTLLAAACDDGKDNNSSCSASTIGVRCKDRLMISCDGKTERYTECTGGCEAKEGAVLCKSATTCDSGFAAKCLDEKTATSCVGTKRQTSVCLGEMRCQFGKCVPPGFACGNGELNDGEVCDGNKFAEGKDLCPSGTTGNVSCTSQCEVDTSACVPEQKTCNVNGVLEAGEVCDGDQFASGKDQCPPGTTGKVSCTSQCEVDTSACVSGGGDINVIFSEAQMTKKTCAFLVELTNLGKDAVDLNACKLLSYVVNPLPKDKFEVVEGSEREVKMEILPGKSSKIDGGKSYILCDEKNVSDGIRKDLCDAKINLETKSGLMLKCGEKVQDVFMVSPVYSICIYGGFLYRGCSVREGVKRFVDEKGKLLASAELARWHVWENGLGKTERKHCIHAGLTLDGCGVTVDRLPTLENTSIQAKFDYKIAGITDKSDKTDDADGLASQIAIGIAEEGNVIYYGEHMSNLLRPDATWSNHDGMDRLLFDTNVFTSEDGFVVPKYGGKYYVDATVSFDQGDTYYVCGKNGIVDDPTSLNESGRVVYTLPSICGNNVVEPGEECDKDDKRSELCSDYIACSDQCKAVCGKKPVCDDGELDYGEKCDRDKYAADACPAGEVFKSCNNKCEVTCQSDPKLCGNNQLDAGEKCDGTFTAPNVCPDGTTYKGCNQCKPDCEVDSLLCGNNLLDAGEKCDGSRLFGADSCDGDKVFDKCENCAATCIDLPACGAADALCDKDNTQNYDYFRACPANQIYVGCSDACKPTCVAPACFTGDGKKKGEKGVLDKRWTLVSGILANNKEQCDGNAIPKFACGPDKVGAKCTDGCALDLSSCRDLVAYWDFGYRVTALQCARKKGSEDMMGLGLPKQALNKDGEEVGDFKIFKGAEELKEIPGGAVSLSGSKISSASEYDECAVRLSDLNAAGFDTGSVHFEVNVKATVDAKYQDLTFAFTMQYSSPKLPKDNVKTKLKIVATSGDKKFEKDTGVLADLKNADTMYTQRISLNLEGLTTENDIKIKVYPYDVNNTNVKMNSIFVENISLSGTKF